MSTGQCGRLSIARAIVRNTPILILDEPTASLDAETQHQVLQNISTWEKESACKRNATLLSIMWWAYRGVGQEDRRET